MTELRQIYQALRALDCAVTRGWPQALVPLPSISFSGCEDSIGEDGSRRFTVELTARAASPEGADELAEGANGIMQGLGLRRSYMKDGAEKDRDTFTKLLRYTRREGPGGGEESGVSLVMGGNTRTAGLISRGGRRAMIDLRTLEDNGARPWPGPVDAETLSLRLPEEALGDALSAFRAGDDVTADGEAALITGYALSEGILRLELCLKGGE